MDKIKSLLGILWACYTHRKWWVGNNVYNKRFKICKICPENNGVWFTICSRCGCFMRFKCRFDLAECELWDKEKNV